MAHPHGWPCGQRAPGRDLIIALIVIFALCLFFSATGIGKPTIGNLIPPPPAGGCPPAVMTAADGAMGALRYDAELGNPPDGLPPAQQTALVRGDYEGCP